MHMYMCMHVYVLPKFTSYLLILMCTCYFMIHIFSTISVLYMCNKWVLPMFIAVILQWLVVYTLFLKDYLKVIGFKGLRYVIVFEKLLLLLKKDRKDNVKYHYKGHIVVCTIYIVVRYTP